VLVDVRILAGGRTVRSGTVRADVELHKRALVAARELRRHEAADAGAVEVVPMWVAPGGSPVVEDPQLLQGRWAKGRIEAGSILREGEFEPAIVVRRGELVSVLCLSGGVEVTTRARALADGRLGDVIECRKDRRSEPFTALVDGVGRVVMSMDAGGPGEGAG
jgi:flagella basal body P-ring formation protein FlgA